MKKTVCLLLVVILTTMILPGCSSKSKLPENDLTIINTKTKEKISIGMSRAEIEGKIGLPHHGTIPIFNHYDGLTILYYENEAVQFILSDSEESKSPWITSRGISTKSSIKEVTKVK